MPRGDGMGPPRNTTQRGAGCRATGPGPAPEGIVFARTAVTKNPINLEHPVITPVALNAGREW